MYTITYVPRSTGKADVRRFKRLEDAKAVARLVLDRTGIVLAIEQV